MDRIGKTAVLIALAEKEEQDTYLRQASSYGYHACVGQVGSMKLKKVVAAIETAARREGLLEESYHQEHALYHAVLEALIGISRGYMQLDELLRTAGLRFSVVVGGKRKDEGRWVAVAVYGMMGAPIKGHEHEVMGLGINHIGG